MREIGDEGGVEGETDEQFTALSIFFLFSLLCQSLSSIKRLHLSCQHYLNGMWLQGLFTEQFIYLFFFPLKFPQDFMHLKVEGSGHGLKGNLKLFKLLSVEDDQQSREKETPFYFLTNFYRFLLKNMYVLHSVVQMKTETLHCTFKHRLSAYSTFNFMI